MQHILSAVFEWFHFAFCSYYDYYLMAWIDWKVKEVSNWSVPCSSNFQLFTRVSKNHLFMENWPCANSLSEDCSNYPSLVTSKWVFIGWVRLACFVISVEESAGSFLNDMKVLGYYYYLKIHRCNRSYKLIWKKTPKLKMNPFVNSK